MDQSMRTLPHMVPSDMNPDIDPPSTPPPSPEEESEEEDDDDESEVEDEDTRDKDDDDDADEKEDENPIKLKKKGISKAEKALKPKKKVSKTEKATKKDKTLTDEVVRKEKVPKDEKASKKEKPRQKISEDPMALKRKSSILSDAGEKKQKLHDAAMVETKPVEAPGPATSVNMEQKLESEIRAVLQTGNLEELTTRKVRKLLEAKLEMDLKDHKDVIKDVVNRIIADMDDEETVEASQESAHNKDPIPSSSMLEAIENAHSTHDVKNAMASLIKVCILAGHCQMYLHLYPFFFLNVLTY
jgi:hypothetical protein